jgi:MraZ protein
VNERGTANWPGEPTCCFTSSYTRSVDAKGRFHLPFRFRNSGGEDESYVAARGPDGAFCLMTSLEWSRAFQRIRERGLTQKSRSDLRHQSQHSHLTRPDSQGRVTIPPEILEQYGIRDKVVVLGMGHYMELWDPERLAAQEKARPEPAPDFMDGFYG